MNVAVGMRLQSLAGKSILGFFEHMCVLHPAIAEMRFQTYQRAPGLSGRLKNLLTAEEAELRDRAEIISKETGIPFWDALLGIFMKCETPPPKFVDAAVIHEPDPKTDTFTLR